MVVSMIYISSSKRLRSKSFAMLIALTSLFLFWVSFKAGMVRHDGHGVIAGQSLAWFALVSFAYSYKQLPYGLSLLSLTVPLTMGLSITSQYISPIRTRLDQWAQEKVQNTYLFIKAAPSHRSRQKLRLIRSQGFERIRTQLEDFSMIPSGADVDILPWDITDLVANNLKYKPRPVIQSYSAYTEALQDLNKAHFDSSKSPSYVVINSQSIDRRIEPDLDYKSLETISHKYTHIGYGSKGSLILKRKPAIAQKSETIWSSTIFDFSKSNLSAKSWLKLPKDMHPGSKFSIIVNPGLSRRILSIAFKPSPILLKIKFNDGSVRSFRFSESTTRDVPLYPFVLDNGTLRDYLHALRGDWKEETSRGLIPVAIKSADNLIDKGITSLKLEIHQPMHRPL
jgi:hypothetical protein